MGGVQGVVVDPGRLGDTGQLPEGKDEARNVVYLPKTLVAWRVVLATKWAASGAHRVALVVGSLWAMSTLELSLWELTLCDLSPFELSDSYDGNVAFLLVVLA